MGFRGDKANLFTFLDILKNYQAESALDRIKAMSEGIRISGSEGDMTIDIRSVFIDPEGPMRGQLEGEFEELKSYDPDNVLTIKVEYFDKGVG